MEEKETQTNSEIINPVQPEGNSPIEQVPNIEIPSVRTYKSDINQTVHKDKISTAKILVAEQNKKRNESNQDVDSSIRRPTNIIIVVLGILLITIAIGGLGYFGYKKITQPIESQTVAPTTFLFVFDKQKYIDSSKNIEEIKQIIQSTDTEDVKDNQYIDYIFYKTNSETKEKTRINTAEFFSVFGVSVPTNIGRSFGKEFVYGMYQTNDALSPFLVIRISDYDLSYSNMFNWESTIGLDLKDLFPNFEKIFDLKKNNSEQTNVTNQFATSTELFSTTTKIGVETPISNIVNREIRFVDTVFSNNNVRVVRNDLGEPIFYYGFIDKTKILFAQDSKIIGQIKQKMKEKNLVR